MPMIELTLADTAARNTDSSSRTRLQHGELQVSVRSRVVVMAVPTSPKGRDTHSLPGLCSTWPPNSLRMADNTLLA